MPNCAPCGGHYKSVFCRFLAFACYCGIYHFWGSHHLILLLLSNHIINVLNVFVYEQAGHLEYSRENCTQALF